MGRGAARAEGLDSGSLQIVDDAGAERPFRPDHDEIDGVGAAKPDYRRMVSEVEGNALRFARDAGIARGADEPVRERACRHLPGQRMLASAGAEEQNVHRLKHMATHMAGPL